MRSALYASSIPGLRAGGRSQQIWELSSGSPDRPLAPGMSYSEAPLHRQTDFLAFRMRVDLLARSLWGVIPTSLNESRPLWPGSFQVCASYLRGKVGKEGVVWSIFVRQNTLLRCAVSLIGMRREASRHCAEFERLASLLEKWQVERGDPILTEILILITPGRWRDELSSA